MWTGTVKAARRARMRQPLGTRSRHFPSLDHGANFLKGLRDGGSQLIGRIEGWMEIAMGTGQAGEGGGSQAEGAKVIDGLTIGLGLTQGQDTVHGLADEVDLGLEVQGNRAFRGLRDGRLLGSVKAML
jgi:hypothetical protein